MDTVYIIVAQYEPENCSESGSSMEASFIADACLSLEEAYSRLTVLSESKKPFIYDKEKSFKSVKKTQVARYCDMIYRIIPFDLINKEPWLVSLYSHSF